MPDEGGDAEPLTTRVEPEETGHFQPDWLPEERGLLFVTRMTDKDSVEVLDMRTGERRLLFEGRSPRCSRTGHIVFVRAAALWSVPFDARELVMTGEPVRVLDGVYVTANGHARYALAGDGTLAYVPWVSGQRSQLAWVDLKGQATSIFEDMESFFWPRLSPDDGSIAVGIRETSGPDVWLYRVPSGARIRLTTGENATVPAWSPDGRRIAFSTPGGLSSKATDGAGASEPLLESSRYATAGNWSKRGSRHRGSRLRLRPPETLAGVEGRWTRAGLVPRQPVPLLPKPGGGVARRGRTGDDFDGIPELLFDQPFGVPPRTGSTTPNYDVSLDGERLLMLTGGPGAGLPEIRVVLGWGARLRERDD